MAINSSDQVTRMGMAGGMWQPHGDYSGKEPGVIILPPQGGMLAAKHVRRAMRRGR